MSDKSQPARKAPVGKRHFWAAGFLALALGTTALTTLPMTGSAQTTTPSAPAVVLPHQRGPQGFADLAARVAPSVVRVTVTGQVEATPASVEIPPDLRGTPLEPFFRQFERGQRAPRGEQRGEQRRNVGQGSGFIIDAAGYIVTNNHVVGEASAVKVELTDGRELPARVIGTDPQTDLALLKVEAGGPLPAVTWGDSDQLRVGDWVVAMGNPFGLGGSVTAGIVSARGRQIGAGPYDDFIQTDAPINPGNSGGPLFNANGEVVGINTAIYAPAGGNVGIGFAVPARMARHVITDLQQDGRVARGWLGVSMQPLNAELASALRLPDARGVLVAGVEPGSPSAAAGVKAGDVVVGIDGRPVAGPSAIGRLGEDQVGGRRAVAVGEAHLGVGEDVQGARAVDGPGLDQHVGGLAAMRAGIHPERAADRARDAAIEGEPVEPGLGRRAGELHVGDRRAGPDRLALDRNRPEGLAAEADDQPRHAAVAHDQVRAEPDHRHGHVGRQGREGGGEVVLVGGGEQHVGRPPDPEPGQVGERMIGQEAAA